MPFDTGAAYADLVGLVRLRSVPVMLLAAYLCGAVVPAAADPGSPSPTPGPAPVPAAEAPPAAIPGGSPGPGNGPVSVIDHDGLYTVGTQIVPGVYSSAGPVAGTKCYWKRVGSADAILDNALTSQPQVVQIEATDIAFKTRGCQPWQLTDGAPPPNQTPPWLSQFQLRQQLDQLNNLARQSGNGELPPY